MTTTTSRRFLFSFACAVLMSLSTSLIVQAAADPEQVLDKIGLRRGICVLLGDGSGPLALDLARQSELLVYVQLADADAAAKAREAAEQQGLDATRVQIDFGDPQRIHLADNLADVVVVIDARIDSGRRDFACSATPR